MYHEIKFITMDDLTKKAKDHEKNFGSFHKLLIKDVERTCLINYDHVELFPQLSFARTLHCSTKLSSTI